MIFKTLDYFFTSKEDKIRKNLVKQFHEILLLIKDVKLRLYLSKQMFVYGENVKLGYTKNAIQTFGFKTDHAYTTFVIYFMNNYRNRIFGIDNEASTNDVLSQESLILRHPKTKNIYKFAWHKFGKPELVANESIDSCETLWYDFSTREGKFT